MIAIDFDDNLIVDEQPHIERCKLTAELINQGYDVYILTGRLQPHLMKMDKGGFWAYYETRQYRDIKNDIQLWCWNNIGEYDWFVTPIKQYKTTMYVDVDSKNWQEVKEMLDKKT